jgi:hypothetical protein
MTTGNDGTRNAPDGTSEATDPVIQGSGFELEDLLSRQEWEFTEDEESGDHGGGEKLIAAALA